VSPAFSIPASLAFSVMSSRPMGWSSPRSDGADGSPGAHIFILKSNNFLVCFLFNIN
jgi:hypothetical protein